MTGRSDKEAFLWQVLKKCGGDNSLVKLYIAFFSIFLCTQSRLKYSYRCIQKKIREEGKMHTFSKQRLVETANHIHNHGLCKPWTMILKFCILIADFSQSHVLVTKALCVLYMRAKLESSVAKWIISLFAIFKTSAPQGSHDDTVCPVLPRFSDGHGLAISSPAHSWTGQHDFGKGWCWLRCMWDTFKSFRISFIPTGKMLLH